jgi:hypothetical protein
LKWVPAPVSPKKEKKKEAKVDNTVVGENNDANELHMRKEARANRIYTNYFFRLPER